ncbi:LysE family translocator [Serratia liquefaciens]|uniref:LysE family translocator n=1 Tax=Serratia liquefaciens TaxID=614 RepID=UPI00382975F5
MIIDFYTLGLFAMSAAVLTLIPGADMLCALSNAVNQGTKAGLTTVLGAVTGVVCHIALAIAGITALIASSPMLYGLFVVVGALYIMWVGFSLFFSDVSLSLERNKNINKSNNLYLKGFFTNLLNPKAIIFMLAFIPQFIRIDAGMPGVQMLILGIVLIVIMLLIEVPLVIFAGKIALKIQLRPALGIYINKAFGGIMLALAAFILVERLFRE